MNGYAQTLRGIYVNDFDEILGNEQQEDSLLSYINSHAFNYMALYDLASLDYTNAGEMHALSSFILKARQEYAIPYVGAVGETKSFFNDLIKSYNNSRSVANERINVFNVEFEFWIASSVEPGGYYCTKYLQPSGCDCDTSGAFKYYISLLKTVDSLATVQAAISETYVGWFNQGQGQQIQSHIDRVLLHAYRVDNTTVWGYSKTRMSYLAANNQEVTVVPIFSSEPDFMGPWLQDHDMNEAFNQYETDFNNDNASWKQYINLLGYQWFNYGFMPKGDAACVLTIPDGLNTGNITSSAATLSWDPLPQSDSVVIKYKKETASSYNYIRLPYTGQGSIQLTGLQAASDYSWRVKTVCGNASGNYSATKNFITAAATAIAEAKQIPTDVMIHPNPASSTTHISITCSKTQQAFLTVSDLTGKKIFTDPFWMTSGKNELDLDVSKYGKGIYLLSIKTARENILKRISVE